ncbi:hypothetical protein LLH00_08735 [bacterium]|nr:hypothetical protein [bacterium]
MKYGRVVIQAGAALPVRTAAEELAAAIGVQIVERETVQAPARNEIVLLTGESGLAQPSVAALSAGRDTSGEWEAVAESGGGLVIAGSAPRSLCRATLGWIANPARETGRFSTFRFEERFTMWDNTLNQWYRMTEGFDRRQHIRELARMGHTAVEINRYADSGGWHVRNREFPSDSYAWYLSYAPALDAFVESPLTAGLYPAEELEHNLADLAEAASLARAYGMETGFVCYEPRSVNEAFFKKNPQLRGSRTDHPGRSLQPRYALDIAHPRVLEHYAEMLTRLMQTLPDLRYLVFWTGDSGSGLPFMEGLYFGPNGSWLARSKPLEQMAAEFSGALAVAGRKINPRFQVLMEIGWEYLENEWKKIIPALPAGVTLTHPLTGSASGILCGADPASGAGAYLPFDRAHGKEPAGEVVISSWWDLEPVFGIQFPWLVREKFASLEALELKRFFTRGGIYSPPQCPYAVNHDVYAELVREREIPDFHGFIFARALDWCEGDKRAAALLVDAWQAGEQALRDWPATNWYHCGPCATQARWITRPLVPDFSKLNQDELAAFERAVFTLEWDVARRNLAFEGGIRMYSEERMEETVAGYDRRVLPKLELTLGLLNKACSQKKLKAVEDQRDRYRALLLLMRTLRNSFAAQAAINRYLLGQGDRAEQKKKMSQAIADETGNTRDWIALFESSRTNFFHISAVEETPFIYKTPLQDLRLRLEVMERHVSDAPGPDLAELRVSTGESTLR